VKISNFIGSVIEAPPGGGGLRRMLVQNVDMASNRLIADGSVSRKRMQLDDPARRGTSRE